MREVIENIQQQIRAIWHYRWHALAATWCISIMGWTYVTILPDMYKSSARVYVETQSVLRPLLEGLIEQTNVLSTVELMRNAVLSKPNLERLAYDTGLASRSTDKAELSLLVQELGKRIAIENDRGGENLYNIEYVDVDPKTAKMLVTVLLDGFVESIQGTGRSDSKMAKLFLDEQIADYELRLSRADDRLKEFKLKNVDAMPREGVDFYVRLQQAKEQLSQVDLELEEAQQVLNSLNRQAEGEEPTFGFAKQKIETKETLELDKRINRLEPQLDDLLLQYTDEHPDVMQLQQTIADLEARKQKIIEEMEMVGGTGMRPEANPIFQQLQMARGTKQAEVTALNVRQREYQDRVKNLENMVDRVPAVEAELAKLDRDYAVVKTQYEKLLARREAARLSSDVDRTSGDVQFKVIDPPTLPLLPSFPMRSLLNSLVLVLAIGAGIGFGYLMSQFKPVFYRGGELSNSGLPLLGVVSMHRTTEMLEHNKLRLKQFVGAGSGLIGVFLIVLII